MKKLACALLFIFSVSSFLVFPEDRIIQNDSIIGNWIIVSGSKYTNVVFTINKCLVYDKENLVFNSSSYTENGYLFIDYLGYSYKLNGDILKLIPYFDSKAIIVLKRK